jgi:hypothetical protein
MEREIGKATACPHCLGVGKLAGKKKCPVCAGEKRVEYQTSESGFAAPAGSWLPTKRRGSTGYLIVLWGPARQALNR